MANREIVVSGGAWISASGCGLLSERRPVVLSPGAPQIPSAHDVFPKRLTRLGRFDSYSRLGCSCVAMALRDAAIGPFATAEDSRVIGLVSSSTCETLATDWSFYQTTLESDGELASPQLFSYTLPNIMIGECAVAFGLRGPTLCLGDGDGLGLSALRQAMELLQYGAAEIMVAGWLDDYESLPDALRDPHALSGAVFVVLELERQGMGQHVRLPKECDCSSILDLFAASNDPSKECLCTSN